MMALKGWLKTIIEYDSDMPKLLDNKKESCPG